MTILYAGKTTTEAHADFDALWSRIGAVEHPQLMGEVGVTSLIYPYGHAMRHGAFCDGVTNDTVALYNAAASAIATGHSVKLLAGATTIGSIRNPAASNFVIESDGTAAATLKQPAVVGSRSITDAVMLNGSATLTSATASFSGADVGKTCVVQGAANPGVGTGPLDAEIIAVLSATTATMNRQATANATGVAVIGAARSVIEMNETYRGNTATPLTGCGIRNLIIDGNKANVPAPVDAGDDITNHGVIFTANSRGFCQNVRVTNCHNTGVDLVINSNYNVVDDVQVTNCGNFTTGMPGFDVNSSAHNTMTNIVVDGCVYGARMLDNCNSNELSVVIRNTSRSALNLSNQIGNFSVGNTVRAVITETQLDYGVGLGAGWRGNDLSFNVSYSGCTLGAGNSLTVTSPTVGVLIGGATLSDANNPRGNTIKIVTFQNGGAGCILDGTHNDYDVTATENSLKTALAAYGIEVNGSYNFVRAACHDTLATQRGVVVRPGTTPVGTAATDNRIELAIPNPSTPWDDQGTNNKLLAGVMYRTIAMPAFACLANTTNNFTVTVAGVVAGDIIAAMPVLGLPTGLGLAGVYSNTDAIVLRLMNQTGSTITTTLNDSWKISITHV